MDNKNKDSNLLTASVLGLLLGIIFSIVSVVEVWEYRDVRLYPILTAVCLLFMIVCIALSGRKN